MGLLDFIKGNFGVGANEPAGATPAPALGIGKPNYFLKDTTPRAVETNNLTIKNAPVDIIEAIAREAIKNGHDPYPHLAEGWKESGMGTISFPGHPPEMKLLNPMQVDVARYPEKQARFMELFNKHPDSAKDYKKAVRDTFIAMGVEQLQKHINDRGLEPGFAKYRGTGQKAVYHGKHVMELHEALKKDEGIRNIVNKVRGEFSKNEEPIKVINPAGIAY